VKSKALRWLNVCTEIHSTTKLNLVNSDVNLKFNNFSVSGLH